MKKSFVLKISQTIVFLLVCCLWGSLQAAPTDLSKGKDKKCPATPANNDTIPASLLEIDEIIIEGNIKTVDRLIMREISLDPGGKFTREEITAHLESDRNRLINTRLFHTVDIDLIDQPSGKADIMIKVTERWYVFPIPIFKLADRNFAEWWTNQGRDLSRVNYGLKFYHYNFRGRGERLRLIAQGGFTRRFELRYLVPYFDKQQKNGLSVRTSYNENKSIAVRSVDHRQDFARADETMRRVATAELNFSHRESFHNFHNFTLGYQGVWVSDTVVRLNRNYLSSGRSRQRGFYASYSFRRDFRNNVAYPLTGWLLRADALKNGLGVIGEVDLYRVDLSFSKYVDLGNGFYASGIVKTRLSNLSQQPYYNFIGLGYGTDLVRGYELNVIESQHFTLNKLTFKKRLFGTKVKMGIIPVEEFQTIPLAVYFKIYYDHALAGNNFEYEGNTRLTNRYLYGYGAGFDIVSYYDFVLRVEYTINSEAETGFFLNFKAEF